MFEYFAELHYLTTQPSVSASIYDITAHGAKVFPEMVHFHYWGISLLLLLAYFGVVNRVVFHIMHAEIQVVGSSE